MAFKDIAGYSGKYKINEQGTVINTLIDKELIKSTYNNNIYVTLIKNKKRKKYMLAFVLASTFIPNPDNCCTVVFIDGNSANTDVSNLKWYSKKNVEHKAVDGEIWTSIRGYSGMYKVSNKGRVKNTVTNRLIRPFKNNDNQYVVVLSKDNDRKKISVSRLVALAFLPNPNKHKYVKNIDGDITNNDIMNLKWDSTSFNKKVRETQTKACIPVNQYALNGTLIKRWDSMSQAVFGTGTRHQGIYLCCKKFQQTANGYIWRYADDKSFVAPRKNIIKPIADEQFKDISGYNGIYQISNLGRVRSIYGVERLLKPHIVNGNHRYTLYMNGVQRSYSAARLVASAFISNPGKYKNIDYIDGNSQNINATNLRWIKRRVRKNRK